MSKIIKTKERGNLIVISGPSGAGKGTIVDGLKNVNENIWVSISMTSREPRKMIFQMKLTFLLVVKNLKRGYLGENF